LAKFRDSLLDPSSHPSRQNDRLSRNVCNYEPTLRNIAEERRPQLQSNESLEPRILTKLLHGDSGHLRREAVQLGRQIPTFRRNRSACIFMSLSDFAGFNNAANCAFAINVTGNSTYLDRYWKSARIKQSSSNRCANTRELYTYVYVCRHPDQSYKHQP